jgi:C1A family cysteine protease
MGELSNPTKREENEYAIMHDIYKYGPVTATIRIFDPTTKGELHQNFYLYKSGVFGTDWNRDPSSSDGYHAIAIVGWGEDMVKGSLVKYWIIRNSWGSDWGIQGFGKVVRGVNRAIIESDIWTMQY